MPIIRIRKINSRQEAEVMLNGGFTAASPEPRVGPLPLAGKTLQFVTPNVLVTFIQSPNEAAGYVSQADVVSTLRTAGFTTIMHDRGRLSLYKSGTALELNVAASTAASILGMGTPNAVIVPDYPTGNPKGKIYNIGTTAPCLVSIVPEESGYLVTTYE